MKIDKQDSNKYHIYEKLNEVCAIFSISSKGDFLGAWTYTYTDKVNKWWLND